MEPTILIAGYYGFGNLGDEAILSVLLLDLAEAVGNHRPIVISGDPSASETLHGIEAIHWREFGSIVDLIADARLLVLGGGGLFQDYWGVSFDEILTVRQQGLSYYASLVTVAQLLGVPHVAHGVGVGPLRTEEGRDLAKFILGSAVSISVRDLLGASEVFALGLGQDASSVHVGSDLALRIPQFPSVHPALPTKQRKGGESLKILGVNLRYWDVEMDPKAMEAAIAEGLDRWLDRRGWKVLFLPFQADPDARYENDLAVIERVRSRMRHRARTNMTIAANPSEVGGAIERCDLFLATRYHSALLALLARKPTAVLSYDPKCQALFEDLGIGDFSLGLKSATSSGIEELLRLLTEEWDDRNGEVADSVDSLKRRGQQQIRLLGEAFAQGKRGSQLPSALAKAITDGLKRGHAISHWPLSLEEIQDLSTQMDRLNEEIDALTQSQEGTKAELQAIKWRHSQAEAELRESRQTVRSLRQERAELSASAAGLRGKANRHERLVAKYLADRNRLLGERSNIRGTRGFRLLASYWRIARRILPAGSWRRRIFNRFLDTLRLINEGLGKSWKTASHLPTNRHMTWEEQTKWVERHLGAFQVFAEEHSPEASHSAVVLAPTPFDPAEGQRSVNFAMELAERGVSVLYAYWRWGLDDPPMQHRLRQRLFSTPLDVFLDQPTDFLGSIQADKKWMILEFPYSGFFDLVAWAHSDNWVIVYDVVDDWAAFHQVGQAPWFDPEFERHLLNSADLVIATSVRLVDKIKEETGRDAYLLANARSSAVVPQATRSKSEREGLTLGYFGSLTGAWFDWELLRKAAKARPAWRFELVGPAMGTHPDEFPPNIILLGKIPQSELGGIASGWDVALVPFKEGPLADAVDPIKVYEYLGLGLPVVVTGVQPPAGLVPHVLRVSGLEGFLTTVESQARRPASERLARISYAESQTWKARVSELVQIIESSPNRLGEKQAMLAS